MRSAIISRDGSFGLKAQIKEVCGWFEPYNQENIKALLSAQS